MRHIVSLIAILALAGCAGGYHRAKREARVATPRAVVIAPAPATTTAEPVAVVVAPAPAPVVRPFARGPIQRACLASDRKARSSELCGCIQAVADQTLSPADQRLAVGFYADPHRAQEIRQSDRAGHESFWRNYTDYAERAEQTCR